MLLDKRARTDIPDMVGMLPIHLAAMYGHTDIVRLLISRDSPVDVKDLVRQWIMRVCSSATYR